MKDSIPCFPGSCIFVVLCCVRTILHAVRAAPALGSARCEGGLEGKAGRMNTHIVRLRAVLIYGLLLIGLSALTACAALSFEKPVTAIQSPASNSEYHAGDTVAVQSTSTDENGIIRVELSVDGSPVQGDVPPQPQREFTVIQTWQATPGSHVITVRAINQANRAGDPADIAITVLPSTANARADATSTPASAPTPIPTPSPASTSVSSACENAASFVVDVTVPDGTPFVPGQAFNKIWRLRNTGTCHWGSGYTLAFIGDELMGAAREIAVPATAPEATADLLVPMKAPETLGIHKGLWRLKTPGGTFFGEEVDVLVDVVAPATAAVCSGTLAIASFSASSDTISAGGSVTLNWGLVSNAQSAEIDNGIGGITTPGSVTVSPSTTTTYTLTAACGSDSITAQVTVTVNPGCSGTPSIAWFSASPTTIQPGESATLSWGLVGDADAAEIDNGIGGVMTPGSVTVTPESTTTYTLTAWCGSNSTTAQATIDVASPTAAPTLVPPTATHTPLPTTTRTPVPTGTHTPLPTPTLTPLPTHTMTSPTATHTPVLPTPTRTPLPSTPTHAPVPMSTHTPTPIR